MVFRTTLDNPIQKIYWPGKLCRHSCRGGMQSLEIRPIRFLVRVWKTWMQRFAANLSMLCTGLDFVLRFASDARNGLTLDRLEIFVLRRVPNSDFNGCTGQACFVSLRGRKIAMHSIKGVLVCVFLLLEFLPASVGTPLIGEKPQSKPFVMAFQTNTVNMTNLSRMRLQNASPSSSVAYFNSKKVATAFAKGGALFDGSGGENKYRVSASRHDKPGLAEIHILDTDIDYVLEGTATYVAGGTVINRKTVAPNEICGNEIAGGETYKLSKGDVIVVPNGVPHWFKDVRAPFLYFQIKLR